MRVTCSTVDEELLVGRWIAQTILVNGEEDQENYPTDEDEMVFYDDYSFWTVDNVYEYEEEGTWELVEENLIQVQIEDYDYLTFFRVLLIDDVNLHLQAIDPYISDEIIVILRRAE